jgi:hypothetical protein
MDFGIAETGIARGSPPGTTTEVLRFGVPFAEIRVVSGWAHKQVGESSSRPDPLVGYGREPCRWGPRGTHVSQP